VDVEKAIQPVNVGIITEAHCRAGIRTYEVIGSLAPTFWAQGTNTRTIAVPINQNGMMLDVIRGVMMMGYMADLSSARLIGRTAEAWSRVQRDGDMFPVEGLASIAETDPEVRTAIIAQGFDLLTGQSHLAMASFDLDDNAQQIWRRTSDEGPTGQFDVFAASVRTFLHQPRTKLSTAEIVEFIDGCGWSLSVIHE
jgi:hypothetical protein